MNKKDFNLPVKDIDLDDGLNVSNIIQQMSSSGGFVAPNVSNGVNIIDTMIQDDDCSCFLSFPDSIPRPNPIVNLENEIVMGEAIMIPNIG